MNYIKIGVLLLFISFLPVSAQHFRAGILMGINASQVDGDSHAGYNKLGFMAGPFVYYPLSTKIDAQLEIKYMGKGANKKTSEYDLTKYTSTLNYLEVPIILRWNTNFKVGWEGGLGFGYLFSHSEKDEYGDIASENAIDFKPFELSWLIGARYKFAQRWIANLRFSYSVMSIFNHQTNNRSGYNNLFSMGISYELR